MDNILNNTYKICKNNDGSLILGITWKNLLNLDIPIVNWEYNRPYDPKRIPEIVCQLEKQEYVDGVIYLVLNDDELICYDGIHRIEALKLLTKQKTEINHKMIIHYYNEYDEMTIKNKFELLNKCIPVPELYTHAHKKLHVKNTIDSIVKHYTTLYKEMFKPSNNPIIPHENRDRFMDKIDYIVTELNMENIDFDTIIDNINAYNEYIKRNINKFKITIKQLKKCNDNNCYLFTNKEWHYAFVNYYRNEVYVNNVL